MKLLVKITNNDRNLDFIVIKREIRLRARSIYFFRWILIEVTGYNLSLFGQHEYEIIR